ncbi:Basic amino-acid permease [Orbilia brochopaga]|uniref:Basic amino-acid permease n=1 Tax=Orbilia brochopaga TaxID=3140254 RepID=A0AAV9V348_9PEZI
MRLCAKVSLVGFLIPLVATSPVDQPQTPDGRVSKEYIVVLKSHLSTRQLLDHTKWTRELHAGYLRRRQESQMPDGEAMPTGLKKVFTIHQFKAYAGSFDAKTLDEIKKNDNVGSFIISQPPRMAILSSAPVTAGEGTFAYVIDSGVNTDHQDFEGRAECGYNALHPETLKHNDTVGHGTHVAGIIASTTYGVAKKAKIISVKVIDRVEYKRNTASDLLDGINWAANDISSKNRSSIAVMNLSIGLNYNRAINDALDNAYKLGILSIVAAGNVNADVAKENSSPNTASKAFVVGATAANNTAWINSNYGKMVDIMAPGVDIKSLGIASNNATMVNTGTSMAAPHVAGLVCYLRRLEGLGTPEQVTARMLQLAQKGVLDGPSLKGSPNLLAFNGNSH